MTGKRRHFGRVRRLPSGRYQARYVGPDGSLRPAPHTFTTKRAAERWLSSIEVEITKGDWIDPTAGNVTIAEYVRVWVADHPKLRRRTRENYGAYLRNQIEPWLGDVRVSELTSPYVRHWLRQLADAGAGEHRRAGAYRLLRAALNTALVDRVISRNPCNLPGAGTVHTPEREALSVDQVFALVEAMPARYRLLVLLATFATLRWGELVGLRRADVDLDARVVRVARAGIQSDTGPIEDDDPKTRSSFRRVAFPEFVAASVKDHLDRFVGPDPDALVFVGPRGGRPRRGNFHRLWRRARERAGVPEVHLHDLRHTGNTLAAEAGASLSDLMKRMGHATTRAALIYLHTREGRDREIADRLDAAVDAARATHERPAAAGRHPAPTTPGTLDAEAEGHARGTTSGGAR